MNIKDTIRSIPGWPIEGVIFRDLTTLMQNPVAYRETCDIFYNRYKEMPIDKVVGIDARGFVFGGVLAYHLNVGFVPVRKKGKLPHKTIAQNYSLEYGESTVEMHADAIEPGEKVGIIDDLIASGSVLTQVPALIRAGARPPAYLAITHPVLLPKAVKRLDSDLIAELVVTDTVHVPEERHHPKLRILSIAPLLAEAIRRIQEGESIGPLVEGTWHTG